MGQVISTLLFQPPENPSPLAQDKYFWLETASGSKIPAFYIQQSHARFTILYSHGNAEDLGMIYNYLSEISRLLYVNVLAYDYSGYGYGARHVDNISNKVEASEENCYSDIEAAFEYLTTVAKINPRHIILYGRSVGSGPSCYLAHKLSTKGDVSLGGMVLHSPFLSVCRVVVDVGLENEYDVFPNVSRIKNVTCPIFIIHGTKDRVVPFYHGRTLYESIPEDIRYSPFWAENMGHNNIESDMCSLFIKRLQRFFLHLIKSQMQADRRTVKRSLSPVAVFFNDTPEEEMNVEPKVKLPRLRSSPMSAVDAFEERWIKSQMSSTGVCRVHSAIEFGEIECSIQPQASTE